MLYVATTDSIFSVGWTHSWADLEIWTCCGISGPWEEGEDFGQGASSPCHQHKLPYDLLQGAQYPAVGSSLLAASVTNIFRKRYHPFHFSASNNSVPWPCLMYNCTSLASQKTSVVTSVLED